MIDFSELDKLVEKCDPEIKLAITRWVMRHIVDQASEGGSYRYLIYERLKFGPEAYVPLCEDGLTISNEFDLNLKSAVRDRLKANDFEGAKRALGCCDEPGCFKAVSCGYPIEDGRYRQTCSEHSDYEQRRQRALAEKENNNV